MRFVRPFALLSALVALLIGGCTGTKPYRADLPDNLTVLAQTEGVDTTLEIYHIDRHCQSQYQGSVTLDNHPVELGIATGKTSYLLVTFSNSSFWRASKSSISSGTLLTPRSGYRYHIDARYKDGIYNVSFFELAGKTGKRRELDAVGLDTCQPQ